MEFTKTDLNKTLWVKPAALEKQRKWYHIDAKGQTLGRLAVIIADKLLGKDKAYMCDFWDTGDYLVVTNVDKVAVTGNKLLDKKYYTYSGYKGNVKSKTLSELLKKTPEKVLWFAVRGMLSKNKLRDRRMKRLKMFAGEAHTFNHLHPVSLTNGS